MSFRANYSRTINSGTVWVGKEGCTSSTIGIRFMMAIGAMSR
jgi:hypothetical protein